MKFIERIKKDSKFAMLLMLGLALIGLVLLIVFIGFTLCFWIMLILWILFYLLFFAKIFVLFKITNMIIWLSFSILLILTIIFIFVGDGSSNAKSVSSSSSKKLSAAECKPYVAKYDNKILKISGDGLVGTIGIKIDPVTCRFTGQYMATFSGSLAQNPDTSFYGSPLYNYIIRMHSPSDTARGDNDYGALSVVRRNAQTLPDPFSDSQVLSVFYRDPSDQTDRASNDFYWSYKIDTNFSESRYQKIFTDNVFEVVDGLPFIESEDMGNGTKSYSINHDRAEMDGKIVKTIDLTISE